MTIRKQISKQLRFEIFKRDGFVCQYCGSHPPQVILECDHIKPVSKGGDNSIENLITACFDCNRGKSNIKLQKVALSINEKHLILKEKDLQFKEYQKLVRVIERRLRKEEDQVSNVYNSWFNEYSLSETFKKSTVRKFINILGVIVVKESMNNACSKINDSDQSIKYFCGICWCKIKGNNYE